MPSTALTHLDAVPLQRLIALPGVYRPQADTLLLADALAREPLSPGAQVVEIGTGTGALALRAAARGAHVTAVDVAWPAVLAARLNGWRRRLRLRVLHGDFADRTRGHRFDLILANPPYVPGPDSRLPTSGAGRAWEAGREGRAVIDRICTAAPALLRPGGVLLMVHSGMCGVQKTLALLAGQGLSARVTERARIPWGPVLRSRAAWLRQAGLAAEGEDQEELVVVRAQYA
ncbi:release factor glutamine methyltransferase [Streptomyces sp. Ag109_G2-6]|uniref:HemK2/MTQ2 family protein methyltransferase n=1 Tax=Streptomyces TaxID=1883 RepID=UPI000FAA266E|nr:MULTISPECIES: HemK2/MTQ2 family protein methyltransferase [Streptomyces]RPF43853.1 release factor glutamine methyltransferase [Streptomyces sp. Ag109_G2-6]